MGKSVVIGFTLSNREKYVPIPILGCGTCVNVHQPNILLDPVHITPKNNQYQYGNMLLTIRNEHTDMYNNPVEINYLNTNIIPSITDTFTTEIANKLISDLRNYTNIEEDMKYYLIACEIQNKKVVKLISAYKNPESGLYNINQKVKAIFMDCNCDYLLLNNIFINKTNIYSI